MKPFDLQAALKGAPVVTRGGRNVKDIAYFPSSRGSFKVRGVVNGEILSWTVEGSYCDYGEHVLNDLLMKPIKRTVWVNVYQSSSTTRGLVSHVWGYATEEDADKNADPNSNRVGGRAWPLEIEE